MKGSPKPRLLLRLLWSHLSLTAIVGLAASVAIYATFYLVEDGAYASIVRAALTKPGQSSKPVLQTGTVDEAAPDVRERAAALPDGVFEWEAGALEQHLALATDEDGTRRIAVLEVGEIEQDRRLAAALATAMLGLSILALGVGYVTARRTLAPLERLAARFGGHGGSPKPEELRRAAGDDEVGLLATELARYLEEREGALDREREFLRDASHELRNPLSILHGQIELLREPGAGHAAAFPERLDRMERSVDRMQRSVEVLLHVARQESAAARRPERPFDQAAADLVAEFSNEAPAEVEIRLQHEGTPGGSPALWLVILRNLLDNAVRATTRGSIDVFLSPDRVRVVDTGQGFEPELCQTVTQAFVHGADSPGFGLGLSIVVRLARRLGWKLSLQSSAGGTTVQLDSSASVEA